jgi:hypothetical protein
VYLGL